MTSVFSTREPKRGDQESFWNKWNAENRAGSTDEYTSRIRDYALQRVAELGGRPRILEIGCGTGWLSGALAEHGEIVGVDLSPQAIEIARTRVPAVSFHAGDFLTMPIDGKFDFVVTADSIAHFVDQPAFISRVKGLLNAGGVFLLMTQNSFVWLRSSYVQPLEHGQYRRWPTLGELRQMLAKDFEILTVSSLAPGGGNVGIMRVVNSAFGWGMVRHLAGRRRATAIFEKLLLGRELVILSRRR